ncbi:MAG: phosphotransferase [Bacilli bacterium]|nr:phosphotransferase [Bacilli bacterium]
MPERIDTSNAEEVEKALLAILEGKAISSLVLDAEETKYVSSVGLRLVLKLKKNYPNLTVTNCAPDVYDVFEMTGFTQIVDIQKALREISIEGCPLIGSGAYGRVYRIDDDTILKSFYRGNPISDIERERALAREAFILGIPTAISFDVVKVKEEKYGVLYELINSDSLLACLKKHPEDYDKYVDEYVKLLNQLHSVETENPNIPLLSKDLEYRLTQVKLGVDEELYQEVARRIRTIKDQNTLIHGDCHFKNIFSTEDGLILIDMDTLMRGNPLIEMANLYRTYVCFDVIDPGNIEKFMNVEEGFCQKLYADLLDRLYGAEKEEVQKKVAFLAYFLLLSHYARAKEKYAMELAKTESIIRSLLPDVESF